MRDATCRKGPWRRASPRGARASTTAQFDLPRLVEAKRDTTISVCLPARDEEDTVGEIVELIQHELVERRRLVDEILVIDDRSIDGTAEASRPMQAPGS